MSDTDREVLHLVGGPFDGGQVQLTETPLHIDIDGVRYKRLDDPNTGEFLGAYGISHEAQVETIARIMTGEQDQPDSELWQLLTDNARRVIANRDAVLKALGLERPADTDAPHGPTLAVIVAALRLYFDITDVSTPVSQNDMRTLAEFIEDGHATTVRYKREAGGDGHA